MADDEEISTTSDEASGSSSSGSSGSDKIFPGHEIFSESETHPGGKFLAPGYENYIKKKPAPTKAKVSDIVQPWTIVHSRLPDPPRAQPEAFPGEAGPASLTWGAEADFNTDPAPTQPIEDALADDQVEGGHGGAGVQKKKPSTKKKPQEKKPGNEVWHMIDFKGEKGKIYSPDDKDVWVEMIRVTTVRFRGSGGKIRIDHYKWPAWPAPPP